jgi:hypothetical protein
VPATSRLRLLAITGLLAVCHYLVQCGAVSLLLLLLLLQLLQRI